MDFAWAGHLHTLPAHDVSCQLGRQHAMFNQVTSERSTRGARCRIFGNAESRREHPAEYCRIVFSPLQSKEEDTTLVDTGRTANAKKRSTIQFCRVDRTARHQWD